jgi:hypothetical protein
MINQNTVVGNKRIAIHSKKFAELSFSVNNSPIG